MKDKPVILVVDDLPENIELLEAYLVPQGYEIVKAANGVEALGKLSGNQIDLILLDVMMPGMDGFEVIHRVRQDNTHRLLPIILVTALQETEDRVKGIEAGCDDFISKPVDKMELLARVRSLLRVKAYNDLLSNYRKELEVAKLSAEKAREYARSLIEASLDPLVTINAQGKITDVNEASVQATGVAREQLIGRDFSDYFTEPDKARAGYQKVFSEGFVRDYPLAIRHTTGRIIDVLYNAAVYKDDKGNVLGVFAAARDITEHKHLEEKIRLMAYYDSLTGLPNRKLFSDRLGIALADARRNHRKVGIAMLDLDNFKGVNDTLGHDVGDLLLKATTERLSAALRKSDTVARFGGDEFLLILPDLNVIEDAVKVGQHIVESFRKPFLIDTHQLVVTTSIGIAVYPDDGTDEGILLKNADIAMYQAKQAGRARYQLYKKA